MGDFLMPTLGADMDSGTVSEWRVGPGSVVHRGDIVAVVETAKSDIEVEVFEDGIVEDLLVDVGQQVPVGTPLARLGPIPGSAPAGVSVTSAAGQPPAPTRSEAPPAPAVQPNGAVAGPSRPAAGGPAPEPLRRPDHHRASPRARHMAAECGVDITAIAGSGPGGAVVARDLDRGPGSAGGGAEAADATDRRAELRQAVGELMARSKREIPHYYLAATIDFAAAEAWLERANSGRPITARLLPASLLLRAVALAARQHQALNGHWVDGFQPSGPVYLGVAVALRGGGLVAPAIRDADTLSLDDLMAALRDVVNRARAGHLRSSELTDPTITVTDLGERGADEVFGVIYPPQVALVGFGRICERPCAVDGLIGVRPVVRATLAADHRASDGREGSALLGTIRDLLQTPEEL